jgi:SAM-dependent methyltransferase
MSTMARSIGLRELLVGIEGLALLRRLYDGTDADAEARLSEVRRILEESEYEAADSVAEADARTGYAAWSGHYDDTDNPIIALEQPAVWSILDRLPPGRALDAACGTGRHARRLIELGHELFAVDWTPEMLGIAKRAVPRARLVEADLLALPLAEEQFDAVVCGLALAHVADLVGAIESLGRVLKVGGHLVVSALHPLQAFLGWHALFEDAGGRRSFVREHAHSHGDYLRAFAAAGLEVRDCLEPSLDEAEIRSKRRAYRHIPDATAAAYLGLPGVLVWEVAKSWTRRSAPRPAAALSAAAPETVASRVNAEFSDPRLVAIYDTVNAYAPEAQPGFYARLAEEMNASSVVDLGCGTGLITCELARLGCEVTGVDPAPAMIEIARTRPACGRVRWIVGGAADVGKCDADLAIMTGHVAQFFLTDDSWQAALVALRSALRPEGRLAFESRNPGAREWEAWTSDARTSVTDALAGPVETWVEAADIADGIVSCVVHYAFAATGKELVSLTRLRFRTQAELIESLAYAGFAVERVYGDWDCRAPGPTTPELIMVAASTSETSSPCR